MSETALMVADAAAPVATVVNNEVASFDDPTNIVFDSEKFRVLDNIAEIMASGGITVPKHLHNNKPDCFAVTLQAFIWHMNPFVVGQKTHVVNGTLGYEAQLVNAAVTNSKAIVGFFNYEYRGEGENLECRVGAVLRGSNDITWNEFLKLSDVKTRNSPLWKTNPKQQLGYLQVKNWARLYTPGSMLGVYSVDELEDGEDIRNIPRFQQPQMLNAPKQGYQQPQQQQSQQQPQTVEAEVIPPSGDGNNQLISEAQRKRAFAIGRNRGLSSEEMSFLCYETAGVNSSTEITRDKYDAVIAAFEAATPGEVIPQ